MVSSKSKSADSLRWKRGKRCLGMDGVLATIHQRICKSADSLRWKRGKRCLGMDGVLATIHQRIF